MQRCFTQKGATQADCMVVFSAPWEAEQTGGMGLGGCVVDHGYMVHGDL